MPEATILYSVTGVVVAGLVVWVVMVLSKAKEPWARPAPAEQPAEEEVAPKADVVAAPPSDPDDTARQTPVALSTGRAKAAAEAAKEAVDAAKTDEPDPPAEKSSET